MTQAAQSARAEARIDILNGGERDHYSISDLSAEFGITARALRFYEDEGLIAPQRHGLSRIYSRRDRGRLAWILRESAWVSASPKSAR